MAAKGFRVPDEIPIVKGEIPAEMDPYSAAINLALRSKGAVYATITDDGRVRMSTDDQEVVADTGAEAANKLFKKDDKNGTL